MYKVIGLGNVGSVLVSPYTMDYPVLLQGTDFVDLNCTSIQSENVNSSARFNILDRIPVTVSYGNVNFYAPDILTWHHTNVSGLNSFSVSLFDQNGDRYILPPNTNFSCVVLVKPMYRL